MTVIIDYGVGNLFSLQSSLDAIGAESCVSGNPAVIEAADRIILPGVGAFGDAVQKLRENGLFTLVKRLAKEGKPILGICLGMQLLFEKSYEHGEYEGLGLIKGKIVPIREYVNQSLKIPQMGWNKLRFPNGKKDSLFRYINEGDYVYFVHSYFATDCCDSVIADTEYGAYLTAAVRQNNVMGCQFHPEKSGECGLNILRAFTEGEKA